MDVLEKAKPTYEDQTATEDSDTTQSARQSRRAVIEQKVRGVFNRLKSARALQAKTPEDLQGDDSRQEGATRLRGLRGRFFGGRKSSQEPDTAELYVPEEWTAAEAPRESVVQSFTGLQNEGELTEVGGPVNHLGRQAQVASGIDLVGDSAEVTTLQKTAVDIAAATYHRKSTEETLNNNFFGNKVAEFVISQVESYEELNAPSLEEADDNFKQILISSLKDKAVNKKALGVGLTLLVNEMVDHDDIVIKRLQAGKRTDRQGERSIDDYWNDLYKEHELLESYFGRRFIPYTEFVITDTNFGDPDPEGFSVIPDREYVMVQEKISGEKLELWKLYSSKYEIPPSTPGLKPEVIAYIKIYEDMMRREGLIPEDQIMINYPTGEVTISDTNHMRSFRNYIDKSKDLLDELGIGDQPELTPELLANILVEKVPAFFDLKGADYTQIMQACSESSPYYKQAMKEINVRHVKNLKALTKAVECFSPEGEHNRYVQALMQKFEITDDQLK